MTRTDLLIITAGLLVGAVVGFVASRELTRMFNSLTVEVGS